MGRAGSLGKARGNTGLNRFSRRLSSSSTNRIVPCPVKSISGAPAGSFLLRLQSQLDQPADGLRPRNAGPGGPGIDCPDGLRLEACRYGLAVLHTGRATSGFFVYSFRHNISVQKKRAGEKRTLPPRLYPPHRNGANGSSIPLYHDRRRRGRDRTGLVCPHPGLCRRAHAPEPVIAAGGRINFSRRPQPAAILLRG